VDRTVLSELVPEYTMAFTVAERGWTGRAAYERRKSAQEAMKKGRDLVCQTPGLSALSYTFFLIRLILPACREGLK
jgi:hypothetical protein